MSEEICHRDHRKLNQILEQVEVLTNVVDELRTELSNLKKLPFNVNHENVSLEFVEENNKVDRVRPRVLRKFKTYFKNIGDSIQTEVTCLVRNVQIHCKRKRNQEPLANGFSISDNLKFFKSKIIKNVQSVRKTQQSSKNTEYKYAMSNQQQQTCFLQKEENQKLTKFIKNGGIIKYIDIKEELGNSIYGSSTSDASAQTEIAVCLCQNDKSFNSNHLSYRNVTKRIQTSPLSMISDNQSATDSNRFIGDLSKSHVKQTFLKNKKIKKYKKCSCRGQCSYALYKLPCNKYKCNIPEKKVNDKISELTLECLSFGEKNNFSTFPNAIREKNDRCFTDFSPVEIRVDKSPSSSLSVDLEVDDYCNSKSMNEFSKRRRARTYIVNKIRENDSIKNCKRTENQLSSNVISTCRNLSERKEKFNEMIENILSQRKCINFGRHYKGHKKSGTANFTERYWPMRNNSKQVQCTIPPLTIQVSNKEISINTSTSDFQPSDILDQSYQVMSDTKCTHFPKIITPKRIKRNVQTQVNKYDKRSHFNYVENIRSSALDDFMKEQNVNKTDENKEMETARKKNAFETCLTETDVSSSQIIWSRIKKYNIYSALQTEEDDNVHSNESANKTCDFNDWQNRIMPVRAFCPYSCNGASAEKDKKGKDKNLITLMLYLTNYQSSKALDFNMSNVSGKLYGCLEKVENITS